MAQAFFTATRSPAALVNVARDALAGLIAAILVIAFAVSYSALILPGDLGSGVPQLLWSILVGTCIAGAIISALTTLPPLGNGMDIPQTAIMIVLSATVAETITRQGGSTASAVLHVLLVMSMTGGLFAILCALIGWFQLASYVRLVPYGVVAGFLAATGCLLLVAGIKLATGRPFSLNNLTTPLSADVAPRALVALLFALALFALRARIKSPFLLPAAIITGALIVDLGLLFGIGSLAGSTGWFLLGLDRATPWQPLQALRGDAVDYGLLLRFLPDAIAIAVVGIISLIVKMVGIESNRATSCDLDAEFRANGIANLVTVPFGGMACGPLTSATRVLTEAGGITRWSGFAAAAIVGGVVFFKLNLPAVAPIPILAGLIIVMGYTLMTDAIRRIITQRDWRNLAFALTVMSICVAYGYIAGVLIGFVGACLAFAFSYSRIGAIRRHVSRAEVASPVDHGSEANTLLRAHGEAIQMYWLSNYMFFGSADAMFERIRQSITKTPAKVRYLLLDFQRVSGSDASAIMSLVKLRDFVRSNGITIVFTGLQPRLAQALVRDDFFTPTSPHKSFATRDEGFAWCENELLRSLLATAPAQSGSVEQNFSNWLLAELGTAATPPLIKRYFERRALSETATLYEQGSAADVIDLIVTGSVTITQRDARDNQQMLRRMRQRTMVGEMGFFSAQHRSASVSIEQPSLLYTLSRTSFDAMKREQPALALAFTGFVVRTLADRLEFSNTEIAALT